MKQRKAQNSILVLATLGVYLGLVFVGATPQVMASAAMARQFDAREEIEVFDDFDNKPDGESLHLGAFSDPSDLSGMPVEPLSPGIAYEPCFYKCLASDIFDGTAAAAHHLGYKLTVHGLPGSFISVKDSPQQAFALMQENQAVRALYSTRPVESHGSVKSTHVRVQSHTQAVVTRLPRGSLASLLVTDAK